MIKGYDIEHEYAVMKAELDHEQAMRRDLHDSTFKEIWMGTNLWRTLPSFFGVIMVQWSGASVVFSYATCRLLSGGVALIPETSCSRRVSKTHSKAPALSCGFTVT